MDIQEILNEIKNGENEINLFISNHNKRIKQKVGQYIFEHYSLIIGDKVRYIKNGEDQLKRFYFDKEQIPIIKNAFLNNGEIIIELNFDTKEISYSQTKDHKKTPLTYALPESEFIFLKRVWNSFHLPSLYKLRATTSLLNQNNIQSIKNTI